MTNPYTQSLEKQAGLWKDIKQIGSNMSPAEIWKGVKHTADKQWWNPAAGVARGYDNAWHGSSQATEGILERDLGKYAKGLGRAGLGAAESVGSVWGGGAAGGALRGGAVHAANSMSRSGIRGAARQISNIVGKSPTGAFAMNAPTRARILGAAAAGGARGLLNKNIFSSMAQGARAASPIMNRVGSGVLNHGTRAAFNPLSYIPRFRHLATQPSALTSIFRPSAWKSFASNPLSAIKNRALIAASSVLGPANLAFLGSDIKDTLAREQINTSNPMGAGTATALATVKNLPFLLSRGWIPGAIADTADRVGVGKAHGDSTEARWARGAGVAEDKILSGPSNPWNSMLHKKYWDLTRKIPDVLNFSEMQIDPSLDDETIDIAQLNQNIWNSDRGTAYRATGGQTYARTPQAQQVRNRVYEKMRPFLVARQL